jgi:hypothetical protein
MDNTQEQPTVSPVEIQSDNPQIPQPIEAPQNDQKETPVSLPVVEPNETEQVVTGEIVTEKPKHPGGRPSKYNEEILIKTKQYFDECFHGVQDMQGKLVKPPRTPLIEELELLLDLDDDTIVEWSKDEDKEEFSATYKRIKKLNKLRLKQILIKGKTNPIGPKFLLEVDHGMISAEKRILLGERNAEPMQVTITDYKSADKSQITEGVTQQVIEEGTE